jgi:hypothetical protein
MVIDRSRPLIQAIQAYESAHGRAPDSLEALVPKFIPAVPTTGLELEGSRHFHYLVEDDPPHRWKLSVHMEALGFKHMRFDPSKRYEIPVSTLRDGWVMVTP